MASKKEYSNFEKNLDLIKVVAVWDQEEGQL